jgi:hypothetical protein
MPVPAVGDAVAMHAPDDLWEGTRECVVVAHVDRPAWDTVSSDPLLAVNTTETDVDAIPIGTAYVLPFVDEAPVSPATGQRWIELPES